MNYPTPEEVYKAKLPQLLIWSKQLPPPGFNHADKEEHIFNIKQQEELLIMNCILNGIKDQLKIQSPESII